MKECENPNNLTSTECDVKVEMLTKSPYLLNWGDKVKAKVKILYDNKKTKQSNQGGEALLQTTPGEPTLVKEDILKHSHNTIGLKWEAPDNMGGSDSLTYRVYGRQVGQQFEEIESGI